MTAFITFVIFATQAEAAVDDPLRREELNWWTGFVLLIAVGTLTYITLMHILPEVFNSNGHDEHDHFHDDLETHLKSKQIDDSNENQDKIKDDDDYITLQEEKETKMGRFWKVFILLLGLYSAELLRFAHH